MREHLRYRLSAGNQLAFAVILKNWMPRTGTLMVLCALSVTRLCAYEAPKTANLTFDPAWHRAGPGHRRPSSGSPDRSGHPTFRIPRTASGLPALAVVIKLHPVSVAAWAANHALVTASTPDGMGLEITRHEAIAELWKTGKKIYKQALTEDERLIGLYCMAVVLEIADKKRPSLCAWAWPHRKPESSALERGPLTSLTSTVSSFTFLQWIFALSTQPSRSFHDSADSIEGKHRATRCRLSLFPLPCSFADIL